MTHKYAVIMESVAFPQLYEVLEEFDNPDQKGMMEHRWQSAGTARKGDITGVWAARKRKRANARASLRERERIMRGRAVAEVWPVRIYVVECM